MKKLMMLFALCSSVCLAADMTDFDNDGLPDKWEANFGLSTNIATGLYGADGDPDNDGLSNMAEYLAGYTVVAGNIYSNYSWAVAGLNPTNAYSLGAGVSDYYRKAKATHAVSLGWMMTDRDYVDDSWETVASNGVSRFTFDGAAGDMIDASAWYGWDRCRLNLAKRAAPEIYAKINYSGPYALSSASLRGYSDLSKNPVVVYAVDEIGKTVLARLVSGSPYQSVTNWVALPNGDSWASPQPLGWARTTKTGWDSQVIEIDMRDASGHIFGYSLPAPAFDVSGSLGDNRIRIRRTIVDGSSSYQAIVLDLTPESDHIVSGADYSQFAMDWGLSGVPGGIDKVLLVYDAFVGAASTLTNNTRAATWTNRLDYTQVKPACVMPVAGASTFEARPVFSWRFFDQNYYAFAIEIRNAGGATIWQSGEQKLPPRDRRTGVCSWVAPVCAGNTLPSGSVFATNTVYGWRVAVLNEKFTLSTMSAAAWSDWSSFRLDCSAPPNSKGKEAVRATVCYSGCAATNETMAYWLGRIRLQAFDNRGFAGTPAAEYRLSTNECRAATNLLAGAASLTLFGLERGRYALRAFVDLNTNGLMDAWESWGYANFADQPGNASPRFDVRLIESSALATQAVAKIVIQDADTDNDGYPDALEWAANPTTSAFLSLTGPAAALPNPLLQ